LSAGWVVVVAVGLATIAIRAAGPLLLGGRPLPPRLRGALDHLAPALLAALIVTEALGGKHRIAVDPRLLAGLGVAAVAVALRAPVLVVIVAAAAATGLARAFL